MSDNRMTELLDGLRNVGNLHEFAELFGFDWHDDSDWTWHDVAVKMADDFEQAIAATLGSDKKLITIALQLVRDHYCYPEQFDESCIELERWCYDHGETDLMEYAMALRCPACAFVPMDDGRSTSRER